MAPASSTLLQDPFKIFVKIEGARSSPTVREINLVNGWIADASPLGNGPMPLADFLSQILSPTLTSLGEEKVVNRTLRGPPRLNQAAWKATLQAQIPRDPDFIGTTFNYLNEVEKGADIATRMGEREYYLSVLEGATTSITILYSFQLRIIMIRDALDHNHLTKSGKTALNKDIYTVFQRRKNGPDWVLLEDDAEFASWKSKREREITRRNVMLELYIAYGLLALVEPAFDPIRAKRQTSRTHVKRLLCAKTCWTANGANPLERNHVKWRQFVVALADAVGGIDASRFVVKFVLETAEYCLFQKP